MKELKEECCRDCGEMSTNHPYNQNSMQTQKVLLSLPMDYFACLISRDEIGVLNSLCDDCHNSRAHHLSGEERAEIMKALLKLE